MTLIVRLEKLRFLVEEMQIAFHLASHAPDDPTARMLARHVVIRAKDFIDHADGLRKPLNKAGFVSKEYRITKKAYSDSFEEYFGDARNKLGAHIQDFDFGKRIELWNDVETVKIDYFADGAREIYVLLQGLAIPGYVPYATPAELADPALLRDLEAYGALLTTGAGVELATDPLAMTRENTTSVLNGTPVHQRASQITLIRRWMKAQRALLAHLQSHQNVARILRERIATDIVSFCDCLITRTVTPGAPQEMDGLDRLLVAAGASADPITQFLSVYDFAAALGPVRDVRDKVGAHLEVDDAVPLTDLLRKIDGFALDDALALYESVEGVFLKVCRSVLFLRLYLGDGRRMQGVTSNSPAVVPYNGRVPVAAAQGPPKPTFDDDAVYSENLEKWRSAHEATRDEGKHYFYTAFMNASAIEQFTTEEKLGSGGIRYNNHQFRTAHRFILDALLNSSDAAVFECLLPLILICGNGDPDVLTEVLQRFLKGSNRPALTPAICFALGKLSRWSNEEVRGHLNRQVANARDPNAALQARIALFDIYIRSEGLIRTNNKVHAVEYADAVGHLSDGLADDARLLLEIVLASQFSRLSIYIRQFTDDRKLVATEIERLCRVCVFGEGFNAAIGTIRALVASEDYVGLSMMIVDQWEADGKSALATELLTLVCRGVVVTAPHDQATRHLAGCFFRLGEVDTALEVATELAARNPDEVMQQLLVVQILSSLPDRRDEAIAKARALRSRYTLNAAQDAQLTAAEMSLGVALSGPPPGTP